MPTIAVSVAHELPKQEALERIKRLLGEVKTQHADKISGLQETWNGDVGTFAFTAMGCDVSGTLTVTDRNVKVEGKLPFLASMFSGQIEGVIRERATQLLAKQEVKAPATPTVSVGVRRRRGTEGAKAPEVVKVTTSDSGGEFFTFDEVLRKLSIDETKLKRLVSEGEIRAFREGDKMKFRRTDVDNLDLTGARSEEESGVIDLSAGKKGDSEPLTDDLIFDEGEDLDLTGVSAQVVAAAEKDVVWLTSHEAFELVARRVVGFTPTQFVMLDNQGLLGGQDVEKGKGYWPNNCRFNRRVVEELSNEALLQALTKVPPPDFKVWYTRHVPRPPETQVEKSLPSEETSKQEGIFGFIGMIVVSILVIAAAAVCVAAIEWIRDSADKSTAAPVVEVAPKSEPVSEQKVGDGVPELFTKKKAGTQPSLPSDKPAEEVPELFTKKKTGTQPSIPSDKPAEEVLELFTKKK